MTEDMDNILGGGQTETTETETTQEVETQETETTVETTTEETIPAASSAAPAESEVVSALRKEIDRVKRQNREYEDFVRRQQEAAQTPPPDFWEQPEAVIRQEVGRVEEQMTARLLNMSEASARARHQDFGEKFEVFAEMVRENPATYQQMLNAPDPAEWAYQAASRTQAMREMGDPAAYREKVRSELRAEMEAEMKRQVDEAIAARLPGGFAEVRSASPKQQAARFAGHRPMGDILGNR